MREDSVDQALINRLSENVMIGIDFPFFFNGDPKDFVWNSNDIENPECNKEILISDYEYSGSHFKAIDKTYDISYELEINTPKTSKIIKFPLITYTYADEGYKDIYQGINIVPIFKIKSDFKIDINVIIN
ncbi:MAG: DUF1926 domain-containing protein [Candidatus Lokiarchaeota archaeon]|nr:DUF1926 domain-containing protein [Candidatus Lokiarchaeota archaeon]MBD3199815.1 DUF1926 domain-containing protein [Candidatus Lokiarchaeota archaeon]